MALPRPLLRLLRRLPPFSRFLRKYEAAVHECVALRARADEFAAREDAVAHQIAAVEAERDRLAAQLAVYERGPFPPGHYHSPLYDPAVLDAGEETQSWPMTLADLDLDAPGQLALIAAVGPASQAYAPPDQRAPSHRFWYDNDFFSYLDASVLAGMLLHFRPQRVIEVGSGYSSAVMFDVDERLLGNSMRITLIEPHPERLLGLLRPEDLARASLIRGLVQGAPMEIYSELGENDFLFIDSSHIAKSGSDLNHLLFDVLPTLRPGVIIHFHDIFHPFDYPHAWLQGGVAWNEAYLLRAFLHNNDAYRILLFNDYLKRCHRDALHAALPVSARDTEPDRALANAPGNSLWLRKVR